MQLAMASGYYREFPWAELPIKQLTRTPPTKNSRGVRLGNMPEIRVVIYEEIEKAFQGQQTAKQALDNAVRRGNEILRRFQQTLRQDPFGLRTELVWFENFRRILTDPFYLGALRTTFLFSAAVILLAMSAGLLLAVTADKQIRGATVYKTLLILPYALAPAVAAALWLFIFHPTIGLVGRTLIRAGIPWDYTLNGAHEIG